MQTRKHQPFKTRELKYIQEHYQSKSDAELATDLRRSVAGVKGMRWEFGWLRRRAERANKNEVEYITANYQHCTDKEIAEKLERTASSIRHIRQKHQLYKKTQKRRTGQAATSSAQMLLSLKWTKQSNTSATV